jgi:hypothetical protein
MMEAIGLMPSDTGRWAASAPAIGYPIGSCRTARSILLAESLWRGRTSCSGAVARSNRRAAASRYFCPADGNVAWARPAGERTMVNTPRRQRAHGRDHADLCWSQSTDPPQDGSIARGALVSRARRVQPEVA